MGKEDKISLCKSCSNYCVRVHNPVKGFAEDVFEKCLVFEDVPKLTVRSCNRYIKDKS